MAKFILEIETSGAAFDDGEEGVTEIARLLRKVADRVEDGEHAMPIIDVNGNRAGFFGLGA